MKRNVIDHQSRLDRRHIRFKPPLTSRFIELILQSVERNTKADKKMRMGHRTIGRDNRPFIIAEMSGNHNQSLGRALQIVEEAARSGADAIKLQTYTAETMTMDTDRSGFCIDDEGSPWNGYRLYQLYEDAHTPWDWHESIFRRASECGLICFSSPFDITAVQFLETLDAPAYKVASFEIVDLPLIKAVARTGKPLIVSTGMATIAEIEDAVHTARDGGCEELVLLKCTSTYPASPEDSNILTIPDMRERFDCEVGISDHTLGLGTSIAAVAHGATVVERHFTLCRSDGGVDSTFSLEPAEMRMLCTEIERAWQSLGKVSYGAKPSERGSLGFRRSLYAKKDIEAGCQITEDNICCIRPGYGLPPKYYDNILGKKVKTRVERGTPLSWTLLENL